MGETARQKPQLWNGFILFYIALPIVLLTLNPFEFQAFTDSESWVWRFSFEDFSRNVLLFFPFGLMLHHSYRQSSSAARIHITALVTGLLFSGFVEVGQLFVEARTSNAVDLISNSSGALLGSLVYQGVFSCSECDRTTHNTTLPFVFMLMPLCWVMSIVSSFRPGFVWGVVPCAIAALSLFRLTPLPNRRKQIAVAVWAIAGILPLINARPTAGFILLASIPAILYGISKIKKSHLRIYVVALQCMSLCIVLQQTYVWYISIEDWVWISARHLSWITILLSLLATGSSFVWYGAEKA